MSVLPPRAAFDRILSDRRTTLFVVLGAAASPPGKVYEGARRSSQTYPHRHAFLSEAADVFTPEELAAWSLCDGAWIVLGGPAPKKVADQGACDALIGPDGLPDMLRIYEAFAKGDAS